MNKIEKNGVQLVGSYPTCRACGSKDVFRHAWTVWNPGSQKWCLKSTFDHYACDNCGDGSYPVWKADEEFRKKRIVRLNDALRRGEGENVSVVITSGVQSIGREFLHEINHAVASFDAFNEGNDPHHEHDFGAVEVMGEKLFWKVDYFDNDLAMLSPDPACPKLTHRVLTIMLASEY